MSKPEDKKNPISLDEIREYSKGYAVIVATACTFIALMFVSTGISLYFIGQSIDPDVIATVEALSHHHATTTGWQLISGVVIGVNAIASFFAYRLFRKLFRVHNQNLAKQEKFKVKFWPIVSMGFVIAIAIGILEAMITATNTSLHGLDPVSIYHALDSGSIYGIISVLIALPVVGVIIIHLGLKTYKYVADWEERHKKFPDLPDHLGKQDSTK